jgi:outer membrane protein OmpA-like peptidoglycan-associated protein/opacity protein-like surface antigen
MKLKWAISLAATVPLAMAAPDALAAENSASENYRGWYTGIGGGANWTFDTTYSGPGTPVAVDIDYQTGWGAYAAIGHDYGWIRAEVEANYRHSDADTWTIAGVTIPAQGNTSSIGVMLNGLIDLLPWRAFTPYIGGGVGWAIVDVDGVTDDSDGEVAFQGIAGASVQILPNTDVTLDARYFSTFGDPEIKQTTGPAVIGLTNGLSGGLDYENLSVMVGLRYTFGPEPVPTTVPEPGIVKTPVLPPIAKPAPAAPPAPVAAPPPRMAETYVVFFAWDRSDLSPVAMQVLDRAVADFRQNGITRIIVEGHADRSGPEAYNENLSRARAQRVTDYLISKDVSPDNIHTAWFGETRPRVQTADDVRHEENRRAEIFLRR